MGVIHKHRGDPAGGDPFLEDFFRDMSPTLARSFTDEQLRAIKMNFAARERGSHTVDLRFSVPLLRRYVVLLIGRERRTARRRRQDRKFHPMATLGNAFAICVLLLVLSVPMFILGYGFKSYFGIDLMQIGGVHTAVEDARQSLVTMIKGM